MAITTLTYTLSVGVNISATGVVPGTAISGVSNPTAFTKSLRISTSAANNTAGGGDEAAAIITTIAPSGSASIDLTSLTNVISQTGQNLARVKLLTFQLLSTSDDSTNGTTCTYVTIGNNGANDFISTAGSGWFGSNTSTLDVPNGGVVAFGTPSAAGCTVNSTRKIIKVLNQDATNSAALQYTVGGGST